MTAQKLSNRMNTVAHTILMRCYVSGNAIATTDTHAERYLIEHGYTAYSLQPEAYDGFDICWKRICRARNGLGKEKGIQQMTKFTTVVFTAATLFAGHAAADPITNLAVYGTDRMVCNLDVDQNWINRDMVQALMADDSRRVKDVLQEISLTGKILQQHIRDSGKVAEYCAARAGR